MDGRSMHNNTGVQIPPKLMFQGGPSNREEPPDHVADKRAYDDSRTQLSSYLYPEQVTIPNPNKRRMVQRADLEVNIHELTNCCSNSIKNKMHSIQSSLSKLQLEGLPWADQIGLPVCLVQALALNGVVSLIVVLTLLIVGLPLQNWLS